MYKFEVDTYNEIFSTSGSRLTNFVGILSQGLRIAPPEAPATGYMVLSINPLSHFSVYGDVSCTSYLSKQYLYLNILLAVWQRGLLC